MVRPVCGVWFKERKISTDLMFILGLINTIDLLAMAYSVCWYGHLERMVTF